MENRQLATTQNFNWNEKQIDTLRKTVAAGANDEELQMFLHLASKYQLDPFAKELFFIQVPTKNGNRNTIMTSRDGYLSIAERNPHYKGIVSDAVYANDKFIKGQEVQHTYSLNNRGELAGAYALVYRDDRIAPIYFFAPIKDYYKESQVWRQYPHAMIVKVAEAMALKRAFSISGLVTQEEIQNEKDTTTEIHEQRKNSDEKQWQNIIVKIWNDFVNFYDGEQEQAKNIIQEIVGKKPSNQWTPEDVKKLDDFLKERYEREEVPNIDENIFDDVEVSEQ